MSFLAPLRRGLRRRNGADYRLLAETFVTLAAASVMIRLLPFRKVAERVSRPPRGRPALTADVARLARSVRFSEGWAPWRAACFQRAVCLQMMLRRRRIPAILHYGIKTGEAGNLRGHVWLSVAGETILGGEAAEGYVCVATFPGASQPV